MGCLKSHISFHTLAFFNKIQMFFDFHIQKDTSDLIVIHDVHISDVWKFGKATSDLLHASRMRMPHR
jgi:hypothetical protein